jgi:enoyl-CoA hydratase
VAIGVTTDAGTAVVTLDRPEARNALNTETVAALTAALTRLDADDGIDAVILTGADPAFCSGLDLKELGSTGGIMGGGQAEAQAARRGGPIPPMDTPLIGAINGPAITGGLEIALNCDFLVASERAVFGDTHARVGLQPGWGGAVLLVEAIGVRRAREMSFTGNFVAADEALRIGLVNHVVAHEELLPYCRRLAADMAGADRSALRRLRRTYREIADAVTAGGWDAEAEAARGWQGSNFDAAEIERRRAAIRDRGRAQVVR